MSKIVLTVALVTCIAGTAAAQDGGKIPWKGKGEEVGGVMAEAKKLGKPMMLFFTSEG